MINEINDLILSFDILRDLFIFLFILFMSLGYDHQGSLTVVVHQVYMRIVKIQLSMYFIMIFKY